MNHFIEQVQNFGIQIISDRPSLIAYSYDNSSYCQTPMAVAFPTDHHQAKNLIKLCFQQEVVFSIRGKATATTGASIAMDTKTLVISTEKMNQILEMNVINQSIKVQAGVLNQRVQDTASEYGFFWPPDPSSMSISTIGGNLACNASGPRAFLFGSARENVLAIKAIDGRGEEFEAGFECTKFSTGYDLVRLLIGSEGTLAFISEATLRLKVKPKKITLCQLFFENFHTAHLAIIELRKSTMIIQSIELLDDKCLALLSQNHSIPSKAKIMLMIEIVDIVDKDEKKLNKGKFSSIECIIANDSVSQHKIKQFRKALSPAIKSYAPNRKNEDIVVPLNRLEDLFELTNQLEKKYHLTVINFGHAGNGNIHCNIMFNENNQNESTKVIAATKELISGVINLKGAISGEHGIGLAKREFISKAIHPHSLELMKKIKLQFDPKNIINPSKIWQ